MRHLRWFSIYQDLDQKRDRDKAYRHDEAAMCLELYGELIGSLSELCVDSRNSMALRFYVSVFRKRILFKFESIQTGTRFHWGFIWHTLQALWLFFGTIYVPYRLKEWGALVRLMPANIRAVIIYVSMFYAHCFTNEIYFRHTEDHLLDIYVPSIAYFVVLETPQLHGLKDEPIFVWGVLGAACVFVICLSLRRRILNSIFKILIASNQLDPAFRQDVGIVRRRVLFASNKLLNLIDRHQFVPTYREMIWEPSRLSANLFIRNSFMKEDIGDLLDVLSFVEVGCKPQKIARSFKDWLSGGQYPLGPKLFLVFLSALVFAFALGPFYNFKFVLASGVPWVLRCMLRISVAAFSPRQSCGDVAKIFAILVSMGVLDFPFAVALLVTNFKILDNLNAAWLLCALVTLLVLTVSDAIAPVILMGAQKIGWVEPPALKVRRERDRKRKLEDEEPFGI